MTITATTHPDLYTLARPIPAHLIKPPAPGKYGDYVPHWVVQQAIYAAVGPFDWQLVEILRGDSAGQRKGKSVAVSNVIVGAVYRMTVVIDGRPTTIEEVGQTGKAYMQEDDGERLKKASSDALKRCGMRLNVALHLWCKTTDEFFLPRVLREAAGDDATTDGHVVLDVINEDDDHGTDGDELGGGAPAVRKLTSTRLATPDMVQAAELDRPSEPDPEAPADDGGAYAEAFDLARLYLKEHTDPTTGTNEAIETRTRGLYDLMRQAEVPKWKGDALHRALVRYVTVTDGLELCEIHHADDATEPHPHAHWGSLKRKEHMQGFAAKSFAAARGAFEG